MNLFGTRGSVLVIAPHADDEVLGAGGTLARLTAAGWDAAVWFVTVSGYPSQARSDVSATESRAAEARAALEALGVARHDTLFSGEEKHLRLDTVPQAELIAFVERGIREVKPSLLLMPCPGHYHQDHRATSQACAAALRPAPAGGRPFVQRVWAYGHAHGGFGGPAYAFQPSAFVDISAVMDAKRRALQAYASQLCAWPHPRSLEAIEHQAAAWGAFAGCAFAEAFETIRDVH